LKLIEVFAAKDETLTEGLKFGRKEIALVNREAKNVNVGIEWEYHVNSELLEKDKEDFDEHDINVLADEKMHRDMARQKVEWTDNFINDYMEAYQVESNTTGLNYIKRVSSEFSKHVDTIVTYEDDFERIMGTYESGDDLDEEDKTVIREYLYSAVTVGDKFNTIQVTMNNINRDKEEELSQWIHLISGGSRNIVTELDEATDNMNEFLQWVKRLTTLEKTRSGFTNYDGLIQKYDQKGKGFFVEFYTSQQWLEQVQVLVGDDDTWTFKVRAHYTMDAVEAWDDQLATNPELLLGYDPKNLDETPFWSQAEQELSGEGDPIHSQDYVDYITEILQKRNPWNIDFNDIERVLIEAGVTDGVETVSKPLKLNDSLALNEQMLTHIRDVGWTDEGTGLHVNVSLRGMNFKRDNFNPAKLILLLNPKMLQEFFQLRGYVGDQFDGLTDMKLSDMAWGVAKYGRGSLIEHFEKSAFDHDKHRQVNFNNFHTKSFDMDLSLDRIEFRYIGGKDYEHRQKTIEWHIYRMVYLTMVAFNEGFAEKEYLKEMQKVLDRESKEKFAGMSFFELVEWWKRNPDGSYNDLNVHATMGKRNTLHKKISGR